MKINILLIIIFCFSFQNKIFAVTECQKCDFFQRSFLSPQSVVIEEDEDKRYFEIDLGIFDIKFTWNFSDAMWNRSEWGRRPPTDYEINYYKDLLTDFLLNNNQLNLKKVLKNSNFDFENEQIQDIQIQTISNKLDCGEFYVWELNINKGYRKVQKIVCKVVVSPGFFKTIEDTLKAHNLFKNKELVPDLYLYKEFKEEHLFFVEFIDTNNRLADYEILMKKMFLSWFYSSTDPEKRWYFGDGDDLARGNTRFFRNNEGHIDARIVDIENHQYLSDIEELKKHFLRLKYDKDAVESAYQKVLLLINSQKLNIKQKLTAIST